MINHQSLPFRSEPFPKVNVISFQTHGLGWEPRYGHSCGCGRNSQYHGSHGSNSSNSHKKKASLHHQKWSNTKAKQENRKYKQDKPPKNYENNCYRYGMKRHWMRTCCTPKHLVDLY